MKKNVQNLTFTALMTAIICITGPMVIPIGMVPMSCANMAVYLTVLLLDKKRATLSVAVYLLIGFVGIPVFSGFTGGAGKLFGPTGGYLIGYLALSWIAGTILEKWKMKDIKKNCNKKVEESVEVKNRFKMQEATVVKAPIENRSNFRIIKQIVALIIGTVCLYLFGTIWLMYQSSFTFSTAFTVGVIPFILFDIVKIIIASWLGKAVRERL